MDLCTSDFTGWAAVEGVQPGTGRQAGFIIARTHADHRLVHVPPEVVIAIHDGHCVRIDRARATISQQGWEAVPAPSESRSPVLPQDRHSQGMGQDMQDWLARFATEIGTTPPTREELDALLELAAVAAHSSARQAAPITCWLAGRAGIDPRDALAAGQRLAKEGEATGS